MMKNDTKKESKNADFYIGVLFILLAGICFGSLGIFGKLFISTGLPTGAVLSIRFLFASFILAGVFLGLKLFKNINLFRVSKRQLLICVLLGVLGYAVFSSFYFMSFRYLSVGVSAMLLFTFPLFVFIGSVLFLKHPFDKRVVGALLLAFLGLFLLLKDEFEIRNALGVYAGLGAAISYAAYVILSDKFQKNIHPLTSSFYVMISAGVCLAILHQPEIDQFWGENFHNMKLFIGLSVIGTIAPLSLFLAGLQRIPGPQASILVMIEPITATLLAFLFFGEVMAFWQMVGIGLVVVADIIIVRTSSK
jgi:drug/metabolite transporter (DMT)-like permease